MVGVIVILAAGGKNGLAAAGKWHNRFDRSLAVHDLHLLSGGSIHKLRVGSAPVLLDHPAEGVVSEVHGVNCKRLAACIPGIRVNAVVSGIAVAVVARRAATDGSHAIGCRRVGGSESKRASGFRDVTK